MLLNGRLRQWRNRCSNPHTPSLSLFSVSQPLSDVLKCGTAGHDTHVSFSNLSYYSFLAEDIPKKYIFLLSLKLPPYLSCSVSHGVILVLSSLSHSLFWRYKLVHVNQNASRAISQHHFFFSFFFFTLKATAWQ